MAQTDIYSMGATRINVGLSTIIRVTPTAYQYAENIKILAGGGTLEIIPTPLALSGASAVGWGLGYPIGASEVVSVSGPAVFYMAATGATMTATILLGYTAGATII